MLANLVHTKIFTGNRISERNAGRALRPIWEAFERRYPGWNAALFDTHFLNVRLARLLLDANTRLSRLDPQEIAAEWASQLTLSEDSRRAYMAELSAILPEFLDLVERELSPELSDG